MALKDWVSGRAATATSATPAAYGRETGRTVATVATVAVATSAKREVRHWRFRLNYLDGSSGEVRTLPEATVAEATLLWPGAIVEPLPDDLEGNNT